MDRVSLEQAKADIEDAFEWALAATDDDDATDAARARVMAFLAQCEAALAACRILVKADGEAYDAEGFMEVARDAIPLARAATGQNGQSPHNTGLCRPRGEEEGYAF